jgi:hypothetical protein
VCSVPLHTSIHVHVNACTLIGLAVAMLQKLPSCTPNLSCRILTLLVIIFRFISVIIYHYSFHLTVDVVLWFTSLTITNAFLNLSPVCIWLSVCIWCRTTSCFSYFNINMFKNTENVVQFRRQ